MTTLTPTHLAELKEKAEAAMRADPQDEVAREDLESLGLYADDANFYAAITPATVLELVRLANERDDLVLLLKRAASTMKPDQRIRSDIVDYFKRHNIPCVTLREMVEEPPHDE